MLVRSKFRFIIEKREGVLVTENKEKKEIIDELKKRGYHADPVKAWEMRHNSDEALVSFFGVFCWIMCRMLE